MFLRSSLSMSNRATRFLAAALAAGLAAVALATGPSSRPGVGAIFYAGGKGQPAGTTFRTWAPNAQGVRVAGTFNGWNGNSHPLYSEGNGWWSVDVNYVYPNAGYKFVIQRPGGSPTASATRSSTSPTSTSGRRTRSRCRRGTIS